jgi:hypothetical protein
MAWQFPGDRTHAVELHDEPAALLGAEFECPHRCGFGRLTARRLHVAEHLGPLAEQRRAPGARCYDTGVRTGRPTRTRQHGQFIGSGPAGVESH